jgi:diguanylate cyclase (GGDEF)-like protein/PAS domain S-box-containing protein
MMSHLDNLARFDADYAELIDRDGMTRTWLADIELDFKKLRMSGQLAQLAVIVDLHRALQQTYVRLAQQRTQGQRFAKDALANAEVQGLEKHLAHLIESLHRDVQRYSNDNIAGIIDAVEAHHGPDWYLVLVSFLVLLPLAGLGGLHKVWTEAKKLRCSQYGTEVILASIADGVILLDSRGRIERLNAAAILLTGWDQGDAQGKPCSQVFRVLTEGSDKFADCKFDQLMADRCEVDWGERANLVQRDGRTVAIEASLSPLSMPSGDDGPGGAIVVFRANGHERSRLRELTREHELFMSGPVVVFRLNVTTDWTLEYITDNADKITGYPVAVWRSGAMRFEQFVHADDLPRLVQMVRQGLLGLDSFDDVYRIVLPNGEIRWFYNHGFAQKDQHGQLTHLHCYAYDISEQRKATVAVQQEQSRFKAMFEQASVGMAHVDRDGCFLRVNKKLCDILGHSSAALTGESVAAIDPAGTACIPFYCYSPHALPGGINAERVFQRSDGEAIWARLNVAVVMESEELPTYYVWVVEDITERRRAVSELAALQAQYQLLFDHMPDPVLILDHTSQVVAANYEGRCKLGLRAAELSGIMVSCLIPELDLTQHLTRLGTGRQLDEIETRFVSPDGSVFDFLASLRLVTLPDRKTLYQWVLRDVTGQKAAQRQIELLAYHDALTGLPNRTLLQDRMGVALENANRHQTQVALMFLDMDNFKDVNDSLGHQAGDVMLQEVGRRLLGCVRKQDTIARNGGDEFVVLLTDLGDLADGAGVARKIVDVLSQPYRVAESVIYCSCSIGISLYPADGVTPELLMKYADVALYDAKGRGGAGFSFFNPAMNVRTIERLDLEQRLREAIDQNEFVLHYQPKIDSASGQLLGAEALIRWVDPSRGIVSPQDFILAAEDSGLIIPIGEWVMREGCRQSKLWEEQGVPLRLSLNVSPRQLLKGDLLATLEGIIAQTGVNPHLIELELTEGILMHPQAVLGLLDALSNLGFQLAVDDFGTGYSCLAYLKQLPVDTLKIDRSFVSDLQSSVNGKAIVKTIVVMAKALGLKVVAEGVETREQSDILGELGCYECQGYFFGRPMGVADFQEMFPANHAVALLP